MKIERTKNAARNVVFGFVLKIYALALPFIMRTAMIYWLGVEYLGLNSLFTSILQVLNLAELGVGSAMTFSMYKPIAEDDNEKICALMHLYRFYYRIIGGVVLVGGLLVLPFLPKLIKGNVPSDINIYILYLLNLAATVLTYWLFAYRNSIFNAYQRTDVISKVTIITDSIKYAIQILVLALLHNYYLYVIVILVTQVLNNIIIAYLSKKMYPQYNPKGKISKEEQQKINKRIKDLFTSKLGGTIVGFADTIVISAFIGLTALAIYQNYFYIITSLSGIVMIIFNAVAGGSGNSMVTESKEKNYQDFKKLSFITYWVIGFVICGLFCLYQTLMKVWVGEKLMLDNNFVLLFCLYFAGNMTIQLLSVYKNAAGIWHEDRFRPLISGLVNLALNLAMVHFIGLYGIVLSTIISIFFISLPWLIHNVFTMIFPGKFKEYIIDLLLYAGVITVVTFITGQICNLIPDSGFGILIVKTLVCTLVCNGLFVLIYMKHPMFKEVLKMVKKIKKR
ncbi:MAG: oligosaccharide flippase family protein [Clostridia bacterium]|nr:oligosaccharide flippase family protein [Clostridia bacterium]